MYLEILKSGQKQGLVFLFQPDHAFALLIDEAGNQMMLDSHLHYLKETDTFLETVKFEGTGALIAFFPKGVNCLPFIFERYPKMMHKMADAGEVIQVLPKN